MLAHQKRSVADKSATSSTTSKSDSHRSVNPSRYYRHRQSQSVPLKLEGLTLVGRSRETTLLHACLDRVRSGICNSEVVLVEGESGTGKSSLVHYSLQEAVPLASGWWAWGKFEQTGLTEKPYGAIVDVLDRLCRAIVERRADLDNEVAQALMERVDDALGLERQVLSSLVPSIDLLSSGVCESRFTEESLKTMTTEFAFRRFKDLLCSFLRAVASKEHPLCIFLDDIQWADDASLQLIEAIANDKRSKYILMVAATRSEEQSQQRTFSSSTFHALTTVRIGNLPVHFVNEIVAQATEMRPERTRELSQTLFQKTQGNVFYVLRYLEMLHSTHLIQFSFELAHWTWDIEEIQSSTSVSDNVGDLLMHRIQDLGADAKHTLMIASCLNSTFSVQALTAIMGKLESDLKTSEVEPSVLHALGESVTEATCDSTDHSEGSEKERISVEIAIDAASQAGLLEQISEHTFKFPHDRVQTSARDMLPGGENGRRLSLRLGEIVLGLSEGDAAEDWMLFAAVDLLTQESQPFLRSCTSLSNEDLASACLTAATRASKRSAFLPAAKYAEKGLEHLSIRAWQENYELCLDLHNLSCQMNYAYANFDRGEKTAIAIIRNARNLEDKLLAYKVRISLLGSLGDLSSAVDVGLDVINQLGVPIPPEPSKRDVDRAFKLTNSLMGDRQPKDLKVLPRIMDATIINQLRFLHNNTIFSWHAGKANLCILQCLTMMHITLTHGYCQFTSHGVAVYGGMISGFGRLEEAYEFGKLAQELLERPEMDEEAPVSIKVIHLFLNHLQKPLYDSLEPLLHGYRLAMQQGDVQIASRILSLHGVLSVVAGMPIENLASQMASYCSFFRDYKQYDCLLEVLPLLQLARKLMGSTESPLGRDDESISSERLAVMKQEPSLRENLVIQLHSVSANMLYYCVFGDFDSAVAECANLKRFDNITYSYFMKPFLIFLAGFSYLCLAQESNRLNQALYKRRGNANLKELRKFVKCGSVNCVPLLVLLEAEYMSFNESASKVVTKYESAISMSGRSGFLLIKSVACERCGQYLLASKEKGYGGLASDYLERSSAGFGEYGANSKVAHMERLYVKHVDFSESRHSSARFRPSSSFQPHLATSWNNSSP